MIKVRENVSLKEFNTFGIDAKARHFAEITSEDQLPDLVKHPLFTTSNRLVLGGGSNVLFNGDFDGLVIRCLITGKTIQSQNDDNVVLQVGAGENWHAFVMHCIKNGWGGIENLSLIPGTVGAAPIQNIGAYGVEIKSVIETVRGVDLETGEPRLFTTAECRFSYRESAFKHELREKIFISSITLRLTKINHRINTQYGAIQSLLKQRGIDHPGIRDVSDAVIDIRRSKLPDPSVIGNAGSFFKNPTVTEKVVAALRIDHPEIVTYPAGNQDVKIAAGWLIENCGWKGKRFGNVGVHAQQSLVLVNYGGGKGEEIFELATKILESVREKFGITLTMEVNII